MSRRMFRLAITIVVVIAVALILLGEAGWCKDTRWAWPGASVPGRAQ